MLDNFRINAKDICYNAKTRRFTFDCSSFFSVGQRMPQIIEVFNEKTGKFARYCYASRRIINGYQIAHWTYMPVPGCENAAKTASLIIFNT